MRAALDRRLHLLKVHLPYHESDRENLIKQLKSGARALQGP